ncbi:MAG: NTP transferase domain-containing protein [Candidatus Magasanikbacteria bacterium]|jgi:D-glycero-alpha-D-manno-heptose 1-phosphate guanylyltransferase|nr:NTP transferase domain-containing protein [Candidatus Magasanikbacteria bacterium]MBT4315101.1 NTP transferase domain-containing protein [Candidatus Magasanikbacteria bacterium]MBT4547011.1 NTP transferase domain-containing protein [Candidatus Magasanikbacteria bacterium]MBT6819065.1 NTP transferase domain-containing protein [Candidatus Magasanikbacteria bacterium]
MNAIILCGGLSTRLGDITKDIPKILLKIGDKTVLDWQLEKLRSVGVKEVVLAAGHLASVLVKDIGFARDGMTIIYAIEDKKLGTGGAIKHGMQYVLNPNDPTIILNGDVLTTIDLDDMVSRMPEKSDGIILGSYVEDVASYGTLNYDDKYHLKEFKEKEGVHKPGYQNGGVYIFNASIKKYFPTSDAFSVEYDVFPKVKDLYVYESDRSWIDVGLPERLEWAKDNWKDFN